MDKQVRKIGVLTSGGDAPGMNAAIRAVVRTALNNNIQVVGIRKGYNGLMNGDIKDLNGKDVSEILGRGGTILHSARALEMLTEEGQQKAANIYKILGLDALVVIGGDGSFRGCRALAKYGVNCIGIPATIDLDISCSEYTIGFDTAVNTGVEAISKLRDTSGSHERCSVCEVMGRDAGYIALWCAMGGGAEEVLIPEEKELGTSERVIKQLLENRSKGKRHNLVVVAEGIGGSQQLAKEIQDTTGIQTRATILGHLQRGGSPTALDRIRASEMGYIAVKSIMEGNVNKIVAYNKGEYQTIDIEEALSMEKQFNPEMYEIIKVLSI
ncbi:6-phosphofructokinase [Tyzzerella sp. An114]|uniref:6-phosphofructokinase n=1 Tax=Tyzzerella sp. An114 TaxID=1965545 RepID=UPI000B45498B|nr:6-phosphofructokinase [Tyzzerella sp. An114]OUQ60441.1 6-phosphofructokinase [Tyzzerella sp. An114]HIT72395.1 6-phosphofructokinase [Candidatus Fimicola cottocaccae]